MEGKDRVFENDFPVSWHGRVPHKASSDELSVVNWFYELLFLLRHLARRRFFI